MRISYDADVDILTIDFDIKRIKLSEEVLPGVIADFDYDGQLVGFEIMDASAFTDFTQIKVLMSRWGREYERVLDENGNFSVQPRTVRIFKPIPAGD